MKGYLRFLAVVAAMLLACILMTALLTKQTQHDRDALLLNDIVMTVGAHIRQPETLGMMQLDTELIVFDSSGVLLFGTENASADISTEIDALRNGWLCMAVMEGDDYLGTVAIPDPLPETYAQMRKRLILIVTVICVILYLMLIGIGLYLYRRIVLPFQKMKRFAAAVAAGDLDEPLMMEQENLFGSFTESFDIMREELRASRNREEQLRQHEKELIARLSHDIKTPVTGIRLICEVLTVRIEEGYLRKKIAEIDRKAEQIHLLAADLLTASLEELGEMQISMQDMSSAELVALCKEHDARNLVTSDDAPECLISADKARLSQVIGNIISNSYKYAATPITVRYVFCGQYLSMELSDCGGGVPEEELAHITEKYYRGKTNAAGKDGSGLGLYIACDLMQRMGGQLKCENRDGGLTVTLLIRLSGCADSASKRKTNKNSGNP